MSRFASCWGQRIRRDRIQVLLWIVGALALARAAYSGVAATYGSHDDRVAILRLSLANPVILLFRGLPSGADEGSFIAFQIVPWLALLAALMSAFLAVRHTRMDEEAGRAELVAATPAGRMLPLATTIVHGLLANLLLGGLVAPALAGSGLPVAGSVLTGAAVASVGAVFLGVGLVAAQLMRTSRAANSVTMTVLLTTFLASGLGNALGTPSDDLQRMRSAWPAWLSPFGWAENTRPFDADLWAPVALAATVAAGLVAAAVALQSVRDLGDSLVAERGARAEARPGLASGQALVWRQSVASVVTWSIGGVVIGLLTTSLSAVVEQMGGDNPAVADVLAAISGGGSLVEGTVTTFFIMVGVFASCCAVQTMARARQDEARGTAELLLGTPVGRVGWFAGHVVVALCSIVAIVLAAVAAAVLGSATSGRAGLMRAVVVAGAGQVAASSVFLAVTALAFVLVPRLVVALGWLLVTVGTMFGLFGPLLGMPPWLTDTSPFSATPAVSNGALQINGLGWLVAVALVGTAASLAAMRRREVTSGG